MSTEEFSRSIVTIDKGELAQLPAEQYKGKIKVIDDISQVENAVKELRGFKSMGFDTETRPSFRKGVQYKVALIQFSTPECSYLFRTNKIGYPEELIKLINDVAVKKIGLSIHDDFINLRRVADIDPEGFVDLQTFVKDYKIADNSLSRVYAILFGKRISKGQRLTNWEQETLTDSQQEYAALDASACLKIYDYLRSGNFDPYTTKYLILPPEPEQISTEEE